MMPRVVRLLLWCCCLFLSYQCFAAVRAAWQRSDANLEAGALNFAETVRMEQEQAQREQGADEAEYAIIWTRRLEPPAPEAAVPAPGQDRPGLALEGVVLEPGNSFAFVRTADGSLRAVRVGEQVDNGVVRRIERTRVVLEVAGQEFELTLREAEQE